MGNTPENNLDSRNKIRQTLDHLRKFSNENRHFKPAVPWFAIGLIGLFDHQIPKGLPSRLEELAIFGFLVEIIRQARLSSRKPKSVEKIEIKLK
jgi:hypothetical protein